MYFYNYFPPQNKNEMVHLLGSRSNTKEHVHKFHYIEEIKVREECEVVYKYACVVWRKISR